MCLITDDEYSEILRQGKRTCRKPRKCCECRRMIGKGEQYESTAGVADDFFSFSCCQHCVAARGWLEYKCDGYIFNFVLADLDEHIEVYPDDAELAAFVAGMRRKWANDDGTLMSVPETTKERNRT